MPSISEWQTFKNQSALKGTPWEDYFLDIYGQLPPHDEEGLWPLNIGDLWMFYDNKYACTHATAGNLPYLA